MRIRPLVVAALAGGALAVTTAAPALATGSDTDASPDTIVRQQVSANFSPKTAKPGDTVTLTVNSTRETGSIALYWGHAPLSYTGHSADATCTVKPGYVFCHEAVKSDDFTFTVGDTDAGSAKVSATVTASCVKDVKTSATLTIEAPESPSPSPSDTPTGEPTGEPTGNPTDEPTGNPTDNPTGEPTDEPSATPSESSSTESASPEPSLTLAGNGGGSGSGSLPVTGTSLGLIVGGAVALLGGGTALTIVARRRRAL